jgi:hypothetical protein
MDPDEPALALDGEMEVKLGQFHERSLSCVG